MAMSTDETFAVGDHVRWFAKSYGAWTRRRLYGTVRRVGAESGALTIAPDDGGKPVVMRRSRYGRPDPCERISAEEIAYQAWLAKVPPNGLVTVGTSADLPRVSFDAAGCDNAKLNALILELIAIETWLTGRPAKS
jgi:hypothetical protein